MLPLDPSKTGLSWANALACADLCAAIYNWPVEGGSFASASVSELITDPGTDAHAVVQDRGDCIVVCFRGSKDAEDYIQDGKFEMTDLEFADGSEVPASVHKGFLEDFDAINVQTIGEVKALLALAIPRRPIFITGHSLGAALATLCALEFSRQKFPLAGIYTFGSPRTGNAAFCEIYDAELKDITFRVINQNDVVPRVPPLLNGYRHVNNCIFLFSNGTYGVNPSIGRRAISNLAGFWNAFRGLHDVLVTDHHIGAYQSKLSEVSAVCTAATNHNS